ncbi:putative Monoheme cytochrome c (modular protein) [Candidatus Nitrospira nitrosa]|jgi:cytochrome c|uniref:Putative Monoheme cytochrome c (Modular protein) n=2 Tax=Candidatus Nitrospira nitrosa TaxID=1742972 RepID=A0A0S4L718_9BACT|nr:cytochrome c [Candidatus Nitrospira nitrosa]CUS32376.1 putative Monoheme cytochrome c (modular protein) [Candidatus Nitrospira nitrosa]
MPDRLLKKCASGVLALLRDSPYRSEYVSSLRSLRPCWTEFLNSLWAALLSVIIPNAVRVQHDEHVYQRTANGLWSVPIGLVMLVLFIPSVGLSAEMGDPGYGAGQPASASDIAAWNIDVSPDGQGLPPGQGTVKQGAELYAMKCAACHGPTGKEGPNDVLVGGQGSLRTTKPLKTIGSYWPYATTLYDYLRRAMPFTAPQSLKADEIYALVAWLLHQNQIIAEDAILDAHSLPKVEMPNRNGFILDPRPDVH